MAGQEAEALSCIKTAQALNPNNASCQTAMAMVCLFQKVPDGALMEHSARAAIRLNPRDPRASMNHFMAGLGEWVKNGFQFSDGVLQSYKTACTHQNATWFIFLSAAMTTAHIGETDLVQTYLDKAQALNPGLTMETYRTAFVFPAWPEWFEYNRADLEALVELGLSRE